MNFDQNLLSPTLVKGLNEWTIGIRQDHAAIIEIEDQQEAWHWFQWVTSRFSVKENHDAFTVFLWEDAGDRNIIEAKAAFDSPSKAFDFIEDQILNAYDSGVDVDAEGDISEVPGGLEITTDTGHWHRTEQEALGLIAGLSSMLRSSTRSRELRRPVSQTAELAHIADYHA